jgi:hypothetical protein
MVQVRFPIGERDSSLLRSIQTGSGSHRCSYLIGIDDFTLGDQLPGREDDHSTPSSGEVKNHGAILPLPPYVFMGFNLKE